MQANIRNELKEKKILYLLIFIGIIIRVVPIFIIVDLSNPQMWEYGVLSKNMFSGNGYSYTYFDSVVPSAIMPPGLPSLYFILFSLFGVTTLAYVLILIFNALLSGIVIYFINKLGTKIYDSKIGLLSATYYCFSPILIYSSLIFNSIIIYHLLVCSLFILFLKYYKNHSQKQTIGGVLIGLVFGVSFFFRAEFLLLLLIISFLFLLSKQYKIALISILLSFLIILPWTVRNYLTFGKVVPISTNFGINFLMGHSPLVVDSVYNQYLKKTTKDSMYEINVSNYSLNRGLNNFINDPGNDIFEDFNKAMSFWFFDKYRTQSMNIIYQIFWLFTILMFMIGIASSFKSSEYRPKLTFMIVILIFSTSLVVFFFNIPRYQIQMSIVIIPTAIYGLNQIFTKYFNKHIRLNNNETL